MCENSSILLRLLFCAAALLAPLSGSGRTLLWSQGSEPSSRNSEERLQTWETLSDRFALSLEQHEQTLSELGQKLQASEASSRQLTLLCELSLRQNERLKNYNSQITERMQERDEDLAASYEKNARKDRTITKLAIAVVALGALILALLALGLTGRLKP